jgi:tryptophanyl-tRNA synthetase
MKRLLTGDRPTGKLHLGHYVGSLKNRVKMQHEYDTFLMVADIQALTDNWANPEKVRENVLNVVLDNLAAGIEPDKVTYFIQSQIPQIAELTVLYSNLATLPELQRNPTVKQEIADKGHIFKDGIVTYGFLGYPISQAADITFCRGEIVPVGEDQKPVVEFTREIVRKFHHHYGEVFPEPETVIGDMPRLAGLDGRKMSKSMGNAIYFADSPDQIREKVMKAQTDTEAEVRYDPQNKEAISNLMTYYKIATGKEYDEIENEFKGVASYKVFKEGLADALISFTDPFRQRREQFESDIDSVWSILESGRMRALQEAEITMDRVREAIKINY